MATFNFPLHIQQSMSWEKTWSSKHSHYAKHHPKLRWQIITLKFEFYISQPDMSAWNSPQTKVDGESLIAVVANVTQITANMSVYQNVCFGHLLTPTEATCLCCLADCLIPDLTGQQLLHWQMNLGGRTEVGARAMFFLSRGGVFPKATVKPLALPETLIINRLLRLWCHNSTLWWPITLQRSTTLTTFPLSIVTGWPGPYLNIKTTFPWIGSSIIKIRRSWDVLSLWWEFLCW